jgi:hypothetical protein
MASSFNKFNCFVEDLAESVHDLDTDSLKIVLTNSAPAAANTVLADITQISAGTGYTAGGNACAIRRGCSCKTRRLRSISSRATRR